MTEIIIIDQTVQGLFACTFLQFDILCLIDCSILIFGIKIQDNYYLTLYQWIFPHSKQATFITQVGLLYKLINNSFHEYLFVSNYVSILIYFN